MSVLDDLLVETRFYRAMHEFAIVAWRRGMTVEALLAMSELLETLTDEVEVPCGE